MSITHEIQVDAQGPTRASLFSWLRRLGRRLLPPPITRALRPTVHRIAAVSEPAGRVFLRPSPARTRTHDDPTLTTLSANLWHDWPRYRRMAERLESFALLVESERADVVLLQEVARLRHFRADEWLAHRLGMAYVYSRANGHETGIGFEEGLAVFSRFPLRAPRLRHLGARANPFVRRLALGAEVDTPFGPLHAFSVHLGLTRGQNTRQLAHLRAWVAEVAGTRSALIGGDFNAHEHSSQIAHARQGWLDLFRHLNPHADGATHELRWPWGRALLRHRLDYIFLHHGAQRWRVLSARHVDSPDGPHSDHRAVVVRLTPLSGLSGPGRTPS